MKVYRPAVSRGLSSFLVALFWPPVLGAFLTGFGLFLAFLERLDHPRRAMSPDGERALVLGLMGACGAISVLLAIRGLLWPLRTQYHVGATELTIHSGVLWHRTTTLPLVAITRIESTSGPLMRLFGLTDLVVYATAPGDAALQGRQMPATVLRGLRDAEEARRFLLDRRESLRESALRGDLSVAHGPQDLQLQRLATAIERLEQRLPRSG